MHDASQPAGRSFSARSLGLHASSAYGSDHVLLYRKFLAQVGKERKWNPAFLAPDASQRDYGDMEFVRRCSPQTLCSAECGGVMLTFVRSKNLHPCELL